MTVRGASAYMNQRATVTSKGDGPNAGWVKVFELPQSKLPRTSSTEQYVFVAWASMGNVLPRAFVSNGNACVEMALGSTSAPFQDARVRWEMTFAHLDQRIGPARCFPATWVRGYITGGGGKFRGTWDASASTGEGIAIWARIFLNGDPINLVDGEFDVCNAGLQAYAIDGLTTSEWFWDRYNPAGPQQCNSWVGSPSGSAQTFFLSSQVGIFDSNDDWLVWGSTRYQPNFVPGQLDTAPCFQVTYSSDGTPGNQVPLLGGYSGDQGTWRCGIRKAGAKPGGLAGLGRWHQHETGGFAVVSSPPDGASLGCRGFDWNATQPNVATMDHFEVFAIRASTRLGNFDFISKDRDTVGNIYNPNAGTLGLSYEPKEFSRPFHASLQLLMCASFDNPGMGAQVGARNRSYALAVQSNGAGVNISHFEWNWTFNRREGTLAVLGEDVRNVRQLDVQMRFYAWQNPIEPATTDYQYALDFTGVQFIWDDAVNVTPNFPPVQGITFGIVPDRETIQPVSLPNLPFEPENDYEVEEQADKRSMVMDDGVTRITWPKFFGVRRTLNVRWLLNATDTDTLRKFFDDRQDRAFAWTPPQESTELAFVPIGQIVTTDIANGEGYETTMTIGELIWVGP